MGRTELGRQLRWLMTLRVVIVTTLLICAFAIELLLQPADTLRPLFMLAATAYGVVLLYAALDRWLHGTKLFAFVQLVGDAAMITLFVGITGGLESPLSFLYLLPISAGSLLLYRPGGLALAGIAWGLYTALVCGAGRFIPLVRGGAVSFEHDPGRVSYFVVAHLVAMFAFALLSAYLSERLRVQGHELAERSGAVARLKALNENIIESMSSGLITTNLAGQVNFVNRGGMEILGRAAAEMEGHSIEELFQLELGALQELRRQLLGQRRYRFERYHQTGDGRRIFLGIAVSNLHDKLGRPLGYLFVFQDLTEIHALELEMRLKERMVALGQMAAGMAHELRNPLAAMSGAVQYLKGTLHAGGETLELMDIILRESHRLDQAIRDFLTFARPGEFAPEQADLVKLLEDSVKLLRKSQEFHAGHRIVTRFAAPRVLGEVDPNRLRQVFWNLATNALKAMPQGGELTLSLELLDGGRAVEIGFRDEGCGMDEAQRERYFQPFASSFSEGTGLGAAIVYRLVAEHGGRILLDSEPGRGTSVRILLPRSQAPAHEAPPPRLAAGGRAR